MSSTVNRIVIIAAAARACFFSLFLMRTFGFGFGLSFLDGYRM